MIKLNTDYKHSDHFFALIEKHVAISKRRVFHFYFEGNGYVVKMQQKRRSKIGYFILTIIAKVLFIPALKGIPIHGGKLTQAIEIKRLRSLSVAGVLVPEVIYEGKNYFVMSSLGNTDFDFLLKNPDQKPLVFYWKQVLAAILNVHHKDKYLSQAFVRNMINVEEATVGFVDFEDDPGLVLSLNLAQVRDWLLCLFSCSFQLDISSRAQAEIVLHYLLQDKIEVQKKVLAYASKIALLRFVFRSTKRYHNRDLQSLNAFIQLMHELTIVFSHMF